MKLTILSIVTLISCCITLCNSLPGGAGGCLGGLPAVGGAHYDTAFGTKTIENKTLTDYSVVFTIGGIAPTGGAFELQRDTEYEIKVSAPEFLGVLVRFEPPAGYETVGILAAKSSTRIADVCQEPTVGITHIINEKKTFATGTIKFPKITGTGEQFDIDLNVVFANNAAVSRFSWGQFKATIIEKVIPPTKAPTKAPTAAPTPKKRCGFFRKLLGLCPK